MSSNQRPDTLMQDRITQLGEIFLHRTAGPYIWVNLCPSTLSADVGITRDNGHRADILGTPKSAKSRHWGA